MQRTQGLGDILTDTPTSNGGFAQDRSAQHLKFCTWVCGRLTRVQPGVSVAIQELKAFTLRTEVLFSFEAGSPIAAVGFELLILLSLFPNYGITGKPHSMRFEFISCPEYRKIVNLIFI